MVHHPIMINGNISFEIAGKKMFFSDRNISIHGAYNLHWEYPPSAQCLGKNVYTTIEIRSPEMLVIQTPATIMREKTLNKELMGLRFELASDDKSKLTRLIEKSGFRPTEYIRKYPRIPASVENRSFPLRAIATLIYPNEEDHDLSHALSIVVDVVNLSPGGILFKTENSHAFAIQTGEHFQMMLEPRGSQFHDQVHLQGQICRIIDELDPRSKNMTRYFGVKFTWTDELNRTAFLDLLKEILNNINKK